MPEQALAMMPIDDAARKYGLHPTTLYRYVRLGYLKKFKRPLDKRTWVNTKALDKALKNLPFQERP
jgi:predicted site-specific integrase-resolvase